MHLLVLVSLVRNIAGWPGSVGRRSTPLHQAEATSIAAKRTVDVTVLSTIHNVADARLHRIVDAFARAELRVAVIGLGDARHGPKGATSVVVLRAGSVGRRALRALIRPFLVRGPLLVVDPETVIPAWLATRARGQPLVVDLHEDYEAVSRDRPWADGLLGVLARGVMKLVIDVAARAELTVVADEHLPPHEALQRIVVRNLPSPSRSSPVAARRGTRPRALYVGDVRPSRGLWTMLDALAAAPDWHLDIVGEVREVRAEELHDRLIALDLQDRVVFHGRQTPELAWMHAAEAWCGLSLLEDTPAYRAAVPSKVYEYLAAGLAVIATPLPRVEQLLTDASAGRCANSPAEVASILRGWSDRPDGIDAHRAGSRAWAAAHLHGRSPFDELADRVRMQLDPRFLDDEPRTAER